MADEIAQRDQNRAVAVQGVSSVDDVSTVTLRVNPTTKRLLTDNGQIANVTFDYLGIVNDTATQDTLTYKTGGSGGSTVMTLVITYAVGAEKVSDTLSSLDYS